MAAPVRLKVLISFALMKPADLLRLVEGHPEWAFMLDSGAFTNFTKGEDVVTLEGYRDFLVEHGHKFWRYVNLDVIGNAEGTRANLTAMQAAGLSPMPVFQRGQTAAELRELLGAHPIVGIGGIAGRMGRPRDRDYLHQVMRIASKYGRRVHLLGVGQEVADRYRPLSADSSDISRSDRFACGSVWDGVRWVTVSKGSPPPPGSRAAALFAPCDWTSSHEWKNQGAIGSVMFRQYVRACRRVARQGRDYVIAITGGDVARVERAWVDVRGEFGWT